MKKNQVLSVIKWTGIKEMLVLSLFILPSFFILQGCSANKTDDKNVNTVNENAAVENNPEADSVKPVDLTDATFQSATEKGIVLVDFWATWCPPCRVQGPIVDDLAGEVSSWATVAKVDVDVNPNVSNSLQIKNIPTILIFKDGQVVKRFVGVQQKNVLLAALNEIK
ncbi:MAG: thioredoxin [Bacteroidota bacterium]